MTRYLSFIASLLFLSACATATLDEGLPKLQGRHIDTAIKYLGLPDNEQQIAGRKVYVWGHQNNGSYIRPVTTPTTYTSYSPYGGSYVTYGRNTSYVTESYNYTCTIKVVVNNKDIIQSSEYSGNEGGCQYYADGLNQFIEDTTVPAPMTKPQSQNINTKKN